jgi:hypothetical protein
VSATQAPWPWAPAAVLVAWVVVAANAVVAAEGAALGLFSIRKRAMLVAQSDSSFARNKVTATVGGVWEGSLGSI